MSRILIVDDERENREALQRALKDANSDWEVMVAAEELEARELIARQIEQRSPIDVLLTDLVMTSNRVE